MNFIALRISLWSPDCIPWGESSDLRDDQCCVGGAVLIWERGLYVSGSPRYLRYPSPRDLSLSLRRLNPYLSVRLGLSYADNILSLNDDGNINDAWLELSDALDWRPDSSSS